MNHLEVTRDRVMVCDERKTVCANRDRRVLSNVRACIDINISRRGAGDVDTMGDLKSGVEKVVVADNRFPIDTDGDRTPVAHSATNYS